MKNTFKFLIAGVMLAFGTAASAVTVTQVLDFGTGLDGSGGTITAIFDNNGMQIGSVGTDIYIGSLSTEGIELNMAGDAYLNLTHVVDGILNFDTVANTMTIDGTVTNIGIFNSTNLFTGGFNSSSFDSNTGVFFATGGGNAGQGLLDALRLDAGGFTYVGFSLQTGNGNVISTDIMASRDGRGITPPAVPIPAAAWLFGSGLIGLVGIARRKV